MKDYFTLKEIRAFLSDEDEVTVLELLDISTDDLVNAFPAKVRERKTYLDKYYDGQRVGEEDTEEDVPHRELRFDKTNYSRLNNPKLWEDAGFDDLD